MQVAQGFIKVANEAMCRPIRALTQMRGYNVANHVLSCFGGAGGQHACAIARSLGMRTIFVHRYSGVLSAVGIGLADMVAERQVRFSPAPTHFSCLVNSHWLSDLLILGSLKGSANQQKIATAISCAFLPCMVGGCLTVLALFTADLQHFAALLDARAESVFGTVAGSMRQKPSNHHFAQLHVGRQKEQVMVS